MSGHTPGPWRFVHGKQIVSARGETIAKAWMFRNGEGVENARLIAAAPDLLEALESIAGEAAFEGLPETKQAAILTAIAKAKGETP